MTMLKGKRVVVTGGAGFLGHHLVELLKTKDCGTISVPRSATTDLREIEACREAVKDCDVVFHLAGNVGGIGYNLERPGELFYDNIVMGVHLMEEARRAGVEKVIAVATICSYPKFAEVPFSEDRLWDGYPEETNAPYGLAKKMLLVQSQAYRKQYGFNSVILFPTNLYGPRDNFDLGSSHVIPAMIRKIHEAKNEGRGVIFWGDGTPTREFLYVKDAARGLIMASEAYNSSEPINLGSGLEISIKSLVARIARIMNFTGEIRWDTSKPNGQPRRKIDTSRAFKEFGFRAEVEFDAGLQETINWYEKVRRSGE